MPANLEGVNVLVVDDDQDILTSVRVAFESNGAKVAMGNDGNKAVEMANRLKPDVIVLDMMMPKKSGFLVMETIKPNAVPGSKPHIIMITANEGKRHELYARSLGVDEYLSKPFATERLIEIVAGLMGRDYREPERW
ncbi:MAG TPA: response regulator [Phycisphaerae bacterium]|nr:response regulator [Phycisphaerae bacterium]